MSTSWEQVSIDHSDLPVAHPTLSDRSAITDGSCNGERAKFSVRQFLKAALIFVAAVLPVLLHGC